MGGIELDEPISETGHDLMASRIPLHLIRAVGSAFVQGCGGDDVDEAQPLPAAAHLLECPGGCFAALRRIVDSDDHI